MANPKHQFRLKTLLLLTAGVGIAIAVFRYAWHWALLLTGSIVPVVVSLVFAHRWARLSSEHQTWKQAAIFAIVPLITWFVWCVFVILGPGEAIFEVFNELIPGIDRWNRVWQ